MQNVLSSLKNMASVMKGATHYNSATLSGAVDVVAVHHDDGTFKSTPFHVRFGKFKVFRSRKKPVKIFVNNVEAPFKMKLGPEGAAYFVHETDAPVDDADYETSPIASPLSSPDISPRTSPLSSPRSEPDDPPTFSLEGTSVNNNSASTSTENSPLLQGRRSGIPSRGSSRDRCSDGELEDNVLSAEDEAKKSYSATTRQKSNTAKGSLDVFLKDSPTINSGAAGNSSAKSDVSFISQQQRILPLLNSPRERSLSNSRPCATYDTKIPAVSDFVYPTTIHPIEMTVRNTFEQSVAVSSAFQIIVWEFKTKAYNVGFSVEFHVTNEATGTLETHVVRSNQRVDSHLEAQKGLFVSPCAGLLLLKWDNTFSKLRNKYLQYFVHHVGSVSGFSPSTHNEGHSHPSPVGSSSDACDAGSVPPSIHFMVATQFGLGRLAVPCTESSPTVGIQLLEGAGSESFSLDRHPIICYCDRSKVYTGYNKNNCNNIASHYGNYNCMENCLTYAWDHDLDVWRTFSSVENNLLSRFNNSDIEIKADSQSNLSAGKLGLDFSTLKLSCRPQPARQSEKEEVRHFKKSVHPTSEQIAQLGLKAGANTLSYEVYSRLQGRSRVECTLFMWSPRAKVVISDVDGTITKSDVMGHVMFMIGRDWTHNGVAPLYAQVATQGYRFVYLTSRNIGQVDNTKTYLHNISQDDCKLPPGAVITSPDGLFAALNREMVQRRPQEFKITALRDLRHCFPTNHNPFYAGFGNRATDVVSYRAVGVPEGRIYIVNPAGEIRHFNHMYRSSYTSLKQLVDVMFPAFSDGSEDDNNAGARIFQDSSFSSYNYWKTKPFDFLGDDNI